MKQTLKKITPRPVWALGSNTYWWWHNRARHVLAQKLDPAWKESQHRLEAYRDIHRGKRGFIIGNGPSLRQMDLSPLKDEITFGLNRIYLIFPEWGFTTSCLVSTNDLVLKQSAEEMMKLPVPKFVTWRVRNWFRNDQQTIFLDSDYTGPENFSGDCSQRIFEGFTVTFTAMQLAYYMGLEEVILIGVDHNFTTKGPANAAIVSQGDDPNHFAPNYFGKGFTWQLPDLEGSERAYLLARAAYEKSGRKILDATVGGKLTIFPKVDFTRLF